MDDAASHKSAITNIGVLHRRQMHMLSSILEERERVVVQIVIGRQSKGGDIVVDTFRGLDRAVEIIRLSAQPRSKLASVIDAPHLNVIVRKNVGPIVVVPIAKLQRSKTTCYVAASFTRPRVSSLSQLIFRRLVERVFLSALTLDRNRKVIPKCLARIKVRNFSL